MHNKFYKIYKYTRSFKFNFQKNANNQLRILSKRNFSKRYRKFNSNIVSQKAKERGRNLWLMNSGILATVFGFCFAMIPLYKLYCQKVGLEGDVEQKNYSKLNISDLGMSRKFKIIFQSDSDPEMGWTFEPVTNELEVHAGETALAFYKVKNNNNKPVIGISTYTMVPEYGANYFAKVQCFCFNQQMLNAQEELYLPLYFYLEPEIVEERKMEGIKTIKINYKFFACKEQKIAEIIHKQTIKELQQKQFILKKRIHKNKAGQEQLAIWKDEFQSNKELLESLLEEDFEESD